jgi:1-phosphofructokinase family hexose kinase
MPARIGVISTAPAVDRTHLVRELRPGTIHRPATVLARPGGKGFNVAHVLHTLGAEVTVAAPLAGASGRWQAEQAGAHGLDVRPTWIPGELRTCLSVFAEADASLTEFYEPPLPVAQADWDRFVADALVAMASADPELVAVSGKLPAGLAPDGLARLVAGLVAQGRFVALDADGHGFGEAAAALPPDALLKVNAGEAAAWLGLTADTADTADAADTADMGDTLVRAAKDATRAGTVVVTMGRDGARAIGTDGAVWRLGTAPVSGHFPVGSGDAFLAGMLAARAVGAGLVSQLRLGAGAAAANTEQPGAGIVGARRALLLAAQVPVTRPA